ncbi:hypothetical protein BFP76_00515 [Amylibacter kogurei]|uniref:Uncharacterized protein n=1 Tax=Paramylibacter kogurei TaxID=1889778 RepID=A0A2G5K7Y8_9RHOB|nr:hypothetical protein [Amylibacter kogurei]PIB25651.1 hypothetical protein BFP76_00515 [Amylibacter kogurei]
MIEIIAEIIVTFLGWTIYGSEENPRHPFWRNSVRTVAFLGAFISIASFLNILGDFEFPRVVVGFWAVCSLMVILVEYYIGSKKVCLAAFVVCAIWFIVGILTQM